MHFGQLVYIRFFSHCSFVYEARCISVARLSVGEQSYCVRSTLWQSRGTFSLCLPFAIALIVDVLNIIASYLSVFRVLPGREGGAGCVV